jgi:hypothetical protein
MMQIGSSLYGIFLQHIRNHSAGMAFWFRYRGRIAALEMALGAEILMTKRKNPPRGQGNDMDFNAMPDGSRSKEGLTDRGVGRLDSRVRTHIGRKIKAVYDEVLQEPVPDRFLNLLDELSKKEREAE